MKNILVTGSLAFDHIMDFPQTFEENILPEKLRTLSVSFLAHNFSRNFGGVAGNIAYNLALLKSKPIIFSSAGGQDFMVYKKHLKNTGVNINLVNELKAEFTANMFMITDKNNCQICGFFPGAMSKDVNLRLSKVIKKRRIDLIVISPTMPEAMDNFVKEAKKLKIPYLYDPAQQIPRIEPKDLVEGINGAKILIGNDYELALISKKTGISKKELLNRAEILITTLGEKGSLIEKGNEKSEVGIVNVKNVVDPTGAGDSYIAGFLSGYVKNYPLNICGQIGSTASSFAIEQYGTQKHSFTIEEFKNRYKQTFKDNTVL